MTETDQVLTYRKDGDIAVISLNRPEKRNALNRALSRALPGAAHPLFKGPVSHLSEPGHHHLRSSPWTTAGMLAFASPGRRRGLP